MSAAKGQKEPIAICVLHDNLHIILTGPTVYKVLRFGSVSVVLK